VEKTVNEHRDQLPAVEVARVEAAIAAARAAAQSDDLAAMTQATDALQRASHTLAEQLSKGAPGASGGRPSQESTVKDGEVVDAEYAETV
jgi:hypothetical protein